MKKMSLLLSVVLFAGSAFGVGMEIKGKDGKPVGGKEATIVTTYREKLTSAGVTATETTGLDRLIKANAEVTPLVNNVVKKIGEGPSQDAIKADPKFFTTLVEKVDVNASQAAEIRADLTIKLGTYGEKLVQAKEAFVGVLGEVAQAGAKANKEKALDVGKTLADTSVNSLKDEVASEAKVRELEAKLGVKLEDFIKRCMELLKK
jgi:hypothetical protein